MVINNTSLWRMRWCGSMLYHVGGGVCAVRLMLITSECLDAESEIASSVRARNVLQ